MLLDENMPRQLTRLFAPEIEAMTVGQRGWRGKENGELLRDAEKEFDAIITVDRGIPHQQSLRDLDLAVVLLEAGGNRFEDLFPLVDGAKEALRTIRPGQLVRVSG